MSLEGVWWFGLVVWAVGVSQFCAVFVAFRADCDFGLFGGFLCFLGLGLV